MNYPMPRSPYRVGRDPYGQLQALRAEMNRMLGSALHGMSGWLPEIDLDETTDGWTVTARLPGIAPDEVEIEVDERELCIRARHSEDSDSPDERSGTASQQSADSRDTVGPRSRRSFDYRFTLPSDVEADNVDATMDHGLLVVRLPRTARSKRRAITVGRRDVNRTTEGTATYGLNENLAR